MKKVLFPIILILCVITLVSAEEFHTLTVTNNLSDAVYYLYLAPADADDWGEDRLGEEILETGADITIQASASSETIYNLMAEDEMEKTYRIDNIDLSNAGSISITDENLLPFGGWNPVNRTLTFYNNTGEDIYYLYVSSNSSMYWGEDILEDDILYSGESFTKELPIDSDYPQHDVLAEGESGASYEIMNENLLEIDQLYFTEETMTSSGDDYDDYDDDYYYDDFDEDDYNGAYLEGYREGFRDAWKEAYQLGFQDAMEE